MKPSNPYSGGPLRDATSSTPRWARAREQPLLWLLFVLSPAAFLILVPAGLPPAVVWAGRIGLGALISLVAWWVYTGFSGYEHFVGWRLVMRSGAPPSTRLTLIVLGMALLTGVPMGLFNLQSAPLAILVAVCTLVALVLLMLRWFAVSAALSIVGIAIGVSALIVVQSVATGFQHEFERRVLGVYAHINVTRPYGIAEYRRFESYLRTVDGVKGASPFVYYAMALAPVAEPGSNDDDLRRATALVKGIEPTTAHEVIDLEEHLASALEEGEGEPPPISALTTELALQPMPGRKDERLPPVIANTPDPRGEGWYPKAMAEWRSLPPEQKFGRRRASIHEDEWPEEFEVDDNSLEDAEALPTMFVGYALARELQLAEGDVVMLVDPGASFDHTQAPEFRRYRIAGVFRAGFQEYDDRLVYIHINELQYFKYRGKDVVSGIDLRLHDPYDAPSVEAELRRTIGDEYTILEWQKLNANLFQSIRTQKTILTIILSLVGTVAGFNVLAALWTMVMRRYAEIAIIMSMGASEGGVARFFQFSGMTLGAVGSLAGVAYGLVLCGLVELYGYSLDPEVYFIEELPVEISLTQIGVVVALTMGISFVATIPPSLQAAKLRPVEGLRYE